MIWLHAMTLADLADPPADAIKSWLAVFCYIAGLVLLVVHLIKAFRSDPPADEKYATKGELSQLEKDSRARAAGNAARVDELRMEMHNRLKELSAYIHDGIHDMKGAQGNMVNQIKDQGETTAELIQELDNRNEARVVKVHDRINEVIDRMPGKIIELLKNTGALRTV